MTDKKVAFVTGASRGIGAAIVRRLGLDGFHVVALARNADKLASIVAEIKDAGGSAEFITCDIADSVALGSAIEKTIETHGRLDVLVNNAGITKDGLILRMEDADFESVIDTNLRSAFIAIRSAARAMMRAKNGRIINISSVSGVSGNAGQSNYAASKAGLIGLSKSVAKELASKNITCNVVAPGFIETDMTQVLPDQVKQKVQEMIPLRRFGKADEIAGVVSFLASPDASYINGQTIVVDGGMI